MFLIAVSLIITFLAVSLGLTVFFKKYDSITNISFLTGLTSTAISILGDSFIIYSPQSLLPMKQFLLIGDVIMSASWLMFAANFARKLSWKGNARLTRFLTYCSPGLIIFILLISQDSLFYAPEFSMNFNLILGNSGYALNIILLIYSIISLVNFEATLKSSKGSIRWNIKYPMIGIGGIIAMNIFYYSHALLYRSLDMNFHPVRVGAVFVSMLFILFSVMRHRFMDVQVTVSRKIVYKSISILIIGLYLFILGLIGQGLNYFGPDIGGKITALLGFIGAALILTAVLSEHVRRRVVVFINKNFYGQKYDYREQWLKFTRRISMKHTLDELLDAIAKGIKDAIGSTGVSIWLKNKEINDEYRCVKAIEAEMVSNGPDSSLVRFLKNKKWILNRYDLSCHHIVEQNYSFFEETRAVLVVPLLNINELIGFVLLNEGLAGDEYNYEDYDLLKTLARQATSAIMNAKLQQELAEAKELETIGRFSSFIIHDLKNAVSNLSLIAQNANEHFENPDFIKDSCRTISHTAEKIEDIIEKLKKLPRKMQLNLNYGDLGICLKSAIRRYEIYGSSRIIFKELQKAYTTFDFDEIKKVAMNIIMNAIDAVDENGEIRITVGVKNETAFFSVKDNGCGMSQEFIKRNLFKPFQTTKSKGLGIGLYQSKVIIEAHGGSISVLSQKGAGSEFTVYLPLSRSRTFV